MSYLDSLIASRRDFADAKRLADEAIELYGANAEAHLISVLPLVTGWRNRRVARLTLDEVNWRSCKEWLPDFPQIRQFATAGQDRSFSLGDTVGLGDGAAI